MLKKVILFFIVVTLFSCQARRMDISERKYSTGKMHMVGENVFVFKNGNQFYCYERLGYTEGTYVWVTDKIIKLNSKSIGFDIPDKESRFLRDFSGKTANFKGSKLRFEGFSFKQVN